MLTRQGPFLEDSLTPAEKDRRYRVLVFDQQSGGTSPIRTVFADQVMFEPRVQCAKDSDFTACFDAMTEMITYVNNIPNNSILTESQEADIKEIDRKTTLAFQDLALALEACGEGHLQCIDPDLTDPVGAFNDLNNDMTKFIYDILFAGNTVNWSMKRYLVDETTRIQIELTNMQIKHNACLAPAP
ncbi:hypothetical protein [Elizabethkingia phage TCUEAP1]|nr:hypothetical protein [Elizabethkingia phage TCUEAP1]